MFKELNSNRGRAIQSRILPEARHWVSKCKKKGEILWIMLNRLRGMTFMTFLLSRSCIRVCQWWQTTNNETERKKANNKYANSISSIHRVCQVYKGYHFCDAEGLHRTKHYHWASTLVLGIVTNLKLAFSSDQNG